jgi:hypothetical protein
MSLAIFHKRKFWSYIFSISFLGITVAAIYQSQDHWDQLFRFTIEVVESEPLTSDQQLEHDVLLENEKKIFHQTIDQWRGKNLWKFLPEEMARQLLSQGIVADVELSRSLPAHLQIKIKWRKLSFLYVNAKGIYPVLQNAHMLPQRRSEKLSSIQLPVVGQSEFFQDEGLREQLVQLLADLPLEGELRGTNIERVEFNAKDGFSLKLRQRKFKIEMGKTDAIKRALRVQQVIAYLDAQSIQPKSIHANLSKKVLVRVPSVNVHPVEPAISVD